MGALQAVGYELSSRQRMTQRYETDDLYDTFKYSEVHMIAHIFPARAIVYLILPYLC